MVPDAAWDSGLVVGYMVESGSFTRPALIAWCCFQPRTRALAQALGGSAHFVTGRAPTGATPLPVRYLRAAIETWRQLRSQRPSLVVAISPPFLCPLVAWAWCRLHRARLVVDCHTDAFHGPRWGWAQPVSRWLARRADLVTLHTEDHQREVAGWGATAILLPDDVPGPGDAERSDSRPSNPRPVVVVAGSLDEQEPVEAAIAAAKLVPDVEMRLTGDPARLRASLLDSAPANVVFTGWLEYPRFLGELLASDVVAAFSLDPHIMNRAAFEAVGLTRPLVLSDLVGLRSRFGEAAVFCANEPDAMASALRSALDAPEELAHRSARLRAVLQSQRESALARLWELLGQRPGHSPRRMLMVSQHPFPDNPTLRRNVEYVLGQGRELDVVCTAEPGSAAPESQPGLHLRRLRLAHRRTSALSYPVEYVAFFLRALPRVMWLSLQHRYECLQVDNLPDFLVFIALLGRLRGARVVLFMYELMPEMTRSRLHAPAGHPLVRLTGWLEQRAISWSDSVITVNEPCRRLLVERGAPPSKVVVVPNSQPSRPLAPVPVRTPVSSLITHATLIERYGVQVAIRALAELRQRWPKLTLSVLGEGDHRHALEQLAGELGLTDGVQFTGFLPWDVAMERIRASTVGIVPVLPDGYGQLLLPNKLFDYVAEGVPVVCSRLPAIQEYFPGNAVAYFEPGDAVGLAAQIERLLNDPELRRRQIQTAREALADLSWERVSEHYLAALEAGP